METDDAAKAEITEQSAPTDADSAGKKVRLDTMESDDGMDF
jgi:hypothetical protein